MLTGSQEEIDTLVENYQSTSQLASFLVVLRKDYDVLKAKKSSVQKEKNVLSQELMYLKRKVYFYLICPLQLHVLCCFAVHVQYNAV